MKFNLIKVNHLIIKNVMVYKILPESEESEESEAIIKEANRRRVVVRVNKSSEYMLLLQVRCPNM